MRRVVIEHIYPPIPDRSTDYCATLIGYEPGDAIGYGRTAESATADLQDQIYEGQEA